MPAPCYECDRVILGTLEDNLHCREVDDGPVQILCLRCFRWAVPPARPQGFTLRKYGYPTRVYE
jgi:hypothetical protein